MLYNHPAFTMDCGHQTLLSPPALHWSAAPLCLWHEAVAHMAFPLAADLPRFKESKPTEIKIHENALSSSLSRRSPSRWNPHGPSQLSLQLRTAAMDWRLRIVSLLTTWEIPWRDIQTAKHSATRRGFSQVQYISILSLRMNKANYEKSRCLSGDGCGALRSERSELGRLWAIFVKCVRCTSWC